MEIFVLVTVLFLLCCFIFFSNNTKKQNLEDELNAEKIKNINLMSEFNKYKATNGELLSIKKQIEAEKSFLNGLEIDATIATYNFSSYDGITSEECKNKIAILKSKEQQVIRDGQATICFGNRDERGKKRYYSNNERQILRCFNTECDNILLSITIRNIDTSRNKIQKSFQTLNKLFEVDEVQLTNDILELKLEELNLAYTAAQKKEAEREEQRAIREQMLEEEKVRRELEREKNRIEKEQRQFENEISKLLKYMQKASDVEKQLYVDKIKELEEKVKMLEKDKENVLEREQNTRAGYVYVISNIGSFGENIYKIGMTRRLEPMDRIKELSSASVPFEFDVHAMIFSDDAPKLETLLHDRFREHQVNKVNSRKEFFNVPLSEIEEVVTSEYNATVTFTMLAKAKQYRESLKIAEKQNSKGANYGKI